MLIREYTHEDVAVLARWLANRGATAGTVADAVEKPWKWHGDLDLALAVQEHEAEHSTGPWHECQPSSDGVWRCAPEWVDGVEQVCPWIFRAPEDYELFV